VRWRAMVVTVFRGEPSVLVPESTVVAVVRLPVVELLPRASVVVAVASVWMSWIVGRSWVFADDYANLALPRHTGLTRDYLTTSVVGHLVVGYRFVDWFLATQRRYDYGTAGIAMVLTCAVTLWVFSRVLVALIGPRTGVAALTAVMAASLLLSPVMLWWAAFLHTMPAMLAALSCMLVFLWRERRPRLWHLAALAVVTALGLCFYETTLLVPGYLALLAFLVLERGGPLRRLVGVLRRWPVWVAVYTLRSRPIRTGLWKN